MTTRERSAGKRGALGKGISSLLGDAGLEGELSPSEAKPRRSEADVETEVVRLKIADIDPNPQQPRKIFSDQKLQDLAASIRQDGVLQAIVVARGDTPGRFVLVAGERRWRASKLAGLEYIPGVIKEGASNDLLRLALIENIQRDDLNIIEEAEAYSALIKDYGLTQEMCADRVGKDRSTVANALRLLALPREIQDDIMESRLTMGHGRAILSIDDKKFMLRARDIVVKKRLSVRQTEQLCKSFKEGRQNTNQNGRQGAEKDAADLNYVAESLRSYLHTKVKVSGSAARGRIEISYFSAGELERILRAMGHEI